MLGIKQNFLANRFRNVIIGLMIQGIGIDQVSKNRIEQAANRWGERFLQRVLTDRERALCLDKGDAVGSIAVRFAAKEAAFKALGTGWGEGVGWKDVEVLNSRNGSPEMVFHGKAARLAVNTRIHCSLSHSKNEAVAVVVLESTAGKESPCKG